MTTTPRHVCLVLALATACTDSPDLDSRDGEIVNGSVDSGHRQVVRVSQFDPSYPGGITEACTGTFIGPRTVLTAKHCTVGYTNGNYATVNVEGTTRVYDAELRKYYFDDYYATSTAIARSATADLAVITLPTPVRGVTMGNLATSVTAGLQITLVGFGGTSASDPTWGTTKRYGFNTIDRTDGGFLFFDGATGAESATCFGDSGGPAFGGGYSSTCVVGVTKGQLNPSPGGTLCSESAGEWFHTRADVNAAWIRANAADAIGSCTP